MQAKPLSIADRIRCMQPASNEIPACPKCKSQYPVRLFTPSYATRLSTTPRSQWFYRQKNRNLDDSGNRRTRVGRSGTGPNLAWGLIAEIFGSLLKRSLGKGSEAETEQTLEARRSQLNERYASLLAQCPSLYI